jgi:4-amino-4-deoxy-L-arabinose transferase-like glycosyltransferase
VPATHKPVQDLNLIMIVPTLRSNLAAIERTVDAWYDSADTTRATLILLSLFIGLWTIFHIIAYSSIGLHADLLEMYAWGQHPAAGYSKHPPLGALIAAAWFSVFPATTWAFHLLAMANAAIGLFFIDLITRRYLSGDKRLLVLLLLLLTPFYQFMGQRFGSSQTLLSTWPIATYCFLRAFETRNIKWSVLVGVTAAVAMLGKYYSIYLIGGMLVAALMHPARQAYFKSQSPWISACCGFIVLAPHIYWLASNSFQPFEYALSAHRSASLAAVTTQIAEYTFGGLAYVALPVAVYLLAIRPNRATLQSALWPSDPDRRMLVVLLAAFLLLPVITAPFIGALLTSMWTMHAWFLLPIVMLLPDNLVLPRRSARHVALLVSAIAIGALIAAPGVAWVYHSYGTKNGIEYYQAGSEVVTSAWRQAFGSRLPIVMGSSDYSASMTFYSQDHPDSVPGLDLRNSPWVNARDLDRVGFVVICGHAEVWCLEDIEARQLNIPNARRIDVDLVNRYLGHAGPPHRVRFLLVPSS